MTVRIAGVRPPPTSPRWGDGRLHFADAGRLSVEAGDWVVVDGDLGIPAGPIGDAGAAAEPGGAGRARPEDEVGQPTGAPWVAEVVVAPEQVVEASQLGPLPRVLRLATDGERPPARTEGAGLGLLRSLGLPEAAIHPGPTPLASAAVTLPDDDRPDQQDDRQQPGPDPAPPDR